MADQQITDLPVATTLEDADLLLTRQGSTDKQVTKAIAFAQHLKGSENLNDVPNKATARTNLDVPQISATALRANNLSDLASASTARTNLGVAIGTNVQAWSAQLDAVAANNTTAGLIAQTGTNTVASRSIVPTSSKIAIVNGTGAAGNIGVDVTEANLNMNNTGTVLAVPKGGSGVASVTANSLILSGTTTTGPFQNIAAPTGAGVLYHRGASTDLPYWLVPQAGLLTAAKTGYSSTSTIELLNIPKAPFGTGFISVIINFSIKMPNTSDKLWMYIGEHTGFNVTPTYATSYKWRNNLNYGAATTGGSDSKIVIYDAAVANTGDILSGKIILLPTIQSEFSCVGTIVNNKNGSGTVPDRMDIIGSAGSVTGGTDYWAIKIVTSSGATMSDSPFVSAYVTNNNTYTWDGFNGQS